MVAAILLSSVMLNLSSRGTLKSTRTSTFWPAKLWLENLLIIPLSPPSGRELSFKGYIINGASNNIESPVFNMLNKELLYKSDYFSFLSKNKNNKQLLPMKLNRQEMFIQKKPHPNPSPSGKGT